MEASERVSACIDGKSTEEDKTNVDLEGGGGGGVDGHEKVDAKPGISARPAEGPKDEKKEASKG